MAAAAASLHTGNTGEREQPGQDARRRWGFEAHPRLRGREDMGGLWPTPPLLPAPAAAACGDGQDPLLPRRRAHRPRAASPELAPPSLAVGVPHRRYPLPPPACNRPLALLEEWKEQRRGEQRARVRSVVELTGVPHHI